jgi:hypothetical protein
MLSKVMKDSRQFHRALRGVEIEINGVRALTSDLSPGGCSAAVRDDFRAGTPVFGWILLDNKPFDYRGQVIWTTPANDGCRVGIRFSGVENGYFKALKA